MKRVAGEVALHCLALALVVLLVVLYHSMAFMKRKDGN